MRTISTGYDFRKDTNYDGRDPDQYSPTLRRYHKLLWSKKLPNGEDFILDDEKENYYLYCKVNDKEYSLSSDGIVHTYSHWKRTKHIIEKIPKDEIEYFYSLGETIGGFLIFPRNRVNNLDTINQDRGKNNFICDRIDLTLECIRLYYKNKQSPLYKTLKRYDDFFKLFENFKGYCEHFLMQDLLSDNFNSIRFMLPFKEFEWEPIPKTVEEYYAYKNNAIIFAQSRNNRIREYAEKNL